jgi:hypothetical protein
MPSAEVLQKKGPAMQNIAGPVQLARPEGFEPPTPWFVAKYSIQMSYGRSRGRIITKTFAASQAHFSATEAAVVPVFDSMPLSNRHGAGK